MNLQSISKSELLRIMDMAQLANAAYSGVAAPPGWSFMNLAGLNLPTGLWNGVDYSNNGADARVLVGGSGEIVVSIRGTEFTSLADLNADIELYEGNTYWRSFRPLLLSLAAQFPGQAISFTGHSLGGATVHQIAEVIAQGRLDQVTAGEFYSFASPLFYADNRVNSFGFANDFVYGLLDSSEENGGDFSRVHANFDAALGPVQGTSIQPHRIAFQVNAIDRIIRSDIFDDTIDLSKHIIVNFAAGLNVPTRLSGEVYNGDVYVIGMDARISRHYADFNDVITGRNTTLGRDYIDGMAGDDHIYGLGGRDIIYGGVGNDLLYGGRGNDDLYGGDGNDKMFGGADRDDLEGGAGNDTLIGDGYSDGLYGGSGNDILYGGGLILDDGANYHYFLGGYGTDTIFGGSGDDTYFIFGGDEDVIQDASRDNQVVFSCYDVDLNVGETIQDSLFDPTVTLTYLSDAASTFVVDSRMIAIGDNFRPLDRDRPALLAIDVASVVTGNTSVYCGDAGSVISVQHYDAVGADREPTLFFWCGDGIDKISVSSRVIRDAFNRYGNADGDLTITMSGYTPGEDSFRFRTGIPKFDFADYETLDDIPRGVPFYDVRNHDDGTDSYFFFTWQGGQQLVSDYFLTIHQF